MNSLSGSWNITKERSATIISNIIIHAASKTEAAFLLFRPQNTLPLCGEDVRPEVLSPEG